MNMLEYTKTILEKVSFDPRIFRKELRKAVKYVTKEEYDYLKSWVRKKFGKRSTTKPNLVKAEF